MPDVQLDPANLGSIQNSVGRSLVIAMAYFLMGLFGLQLAVPPGYASAVFPSSGLALAVILLYGFRISPGIFLGSLALNLFITSKSVPIDSSAVFVSMGIAVGALLQAAAGWLLLHKKTKSNLWQSDLKSILLFLTLAGPVSTLINSSWSVTLLYLHGFVPLSGFTHNWVMWWVGDAIGAMVFTPMIISLLERPLFDWTQRKFLIVLPSFILFGFVVVFYFLVSEQLNARVRTQFHERVQLYGNLIKNYAERNEIALTATQGFLANSTPHRNSFRDFSGSILNSLVGIRSIQWVPRVSQVNRKAFEQEAGAEGMMSQGIVELNEQKQILPSQIREEYFPIYFSEPYSRDFKLYGLDLYSNSRRRAILQSAVEKNGPLVSETFELIPRAGLAPSPGFYWVFPIFDKGKKSVVQGFLIGVFSLRSFIEAALGDVDLSDVNFMISDMTTGQPQHLVTYGESESLKATKSYEELLKSVPQSQIVSSDVSFGHRQWMIDLFPTEKFLRTHQDLTAWSIFVGGLALVILLQTLLLITAGRTVLIEELVKQKTLEVEEGQKFLETVLDNLPVALFCKNIDNDFRFSLWNRRAQDLFGLSREQILGKTDYDFFPPEQANLFLEKDKEAVASRRVLDIKEEVINTPKGTFLLHTKKVPIADAQGKAKYLLGISEDITDRKESERIIDEQRAMIVQAERMKALGEMAGGIAHEVNNPLAIISQTASLMTLLLQNEPADIGRLRTLATTINSTVHRIGSIIKGLRAVARDAENDPMEKVLVKAVVDETLELCKMRFFHHGIKLEIGPVPEDLTFLGRRAQIAQVLINLLNNSYDAVENRESPEIRIDAQETNGLVEITVTDNGPGISSEIASKIMQPFFTTKDVGKGTGLGLSIAQGIIKTHGGLLFFDAKSTKTKFVIQLPALTRKAA